MDIKSDIFNSRFFLKTDPITNEFTWNDLKWDFVNRGWWSRIYEYNWLIKTASSYFEDIKQKSVIDVATGNQHPGMFILKNLGFSNVVGTDLFDVNNNKYAYASHLKNGIEYIKDDILNPSIKRKFDCVCCISVLEHINNHEQEKALTNLIGYLNEHGCLILTFDTNGINSKGNLLQYLDILSKNNMNVALKEVEDIISIIVSSEGRCNNVPRSVVRHNLSCYRIFAWR